MQEQQTGAPPQPKGEVQPTPEKGRSIEAKKGDIRAATEGAFRGLVPQNPTDEQLSAIDANPAAKKIFASEFFGNVTKSDLDATFHDDDGTKKDRFPNGIEFPDGKADANGVVKGTPVWVWVDGEKMRLASIPREQADDMDSADSLQVKVVSEDGNSRDTVTLSRQAIIEANLYSEREAIVKGFEGNPDEQAIVKAYLESINPDPDTKVDESTLPSDEVLEKVANDQKMLTHEEAALVLDMIARYKPDIQAAFDSLDDRRFISHDEFINLVKGEGVYAKDTIATRRDELTKEKAEHQAKIDAGTTQDEDGNQLQGSIDRIDQKLAALQKADAFIPDDLSRAAEQKQGAPLIPDTPEGIDALNDRVGSVIEAEMKKLEARMEPMINSGNTENSAMRHMNQQYDQLRIALGARGEFGAITRNAILRGIASDGGGIGIQRLVTDSEFLAQVDQAQAKAKEFAEKAGLSPTHQEALLKAFSSPEDLPDFLLSSDETMRSAAEQAVKGIFGTEVSDTQADAMFDALLDSNAAIYDATSRAKIKRFLTENKGKKLALLAILLAGVPIVLAGLTAAATVEMAGSAMKT